MHPIERLRYVARASGAPARLLAHETAGALISFASEPAGLVTACRRIVERQPGSGALVWLAARALTARDPIAELRAAVDEIEDDPTPKALAYELPDDATVSVIGWGDRVAEALPSRGDLTVMVIDALGEGSGLAARLERDDIIAYDVRRDGLEAAVVDSDLVLIEPTAAGPTEALAVAGSYAAAAVARSADIPVWMTAGVGTWLPQRMWDGLVTRVERTGDPWDREDTILPLKLVDEVVSPKGRVSLSAAIEMTDCPVAPELFGSG